MDTTVTGIFQSQKLASLATKSLVDAGFPPDQLRGVDSGSPHRHAFIDTKTTGRMMSEGDSDSTSTSYTVRGETIGPDGKPCTMRQVIKVESNDKHVLSMYGPGMDGKEMKVMEIVYTRKK